MDRQAWLAERRRAVVAAYDAEAPDYDKSEYPSDLQQEWVARALRLIPPGGIVLDAPCGTGKYFPLVAAAGHQVVGVDQSAGMLAQARARGVAVELEQVALQNLSYAGGFDAVITVDAMENIPPDDWPLVLANLHRAVRQGGLMYMTVEEVEQAKIDEAFRNLCALGLPAVRGEIVEGDVLNGPSPHLTPERVPSWVPQTGDCSLRGQHVAAGRAPGSGIRDEPGRRSRHSSGRHHPLGPGTA